MANPVIIVTGANGQLGTCVKDLAGNYPMFSFHFFSREEFPIDQPEIIQSVFSNLKPQFCINCAAYTAVDLAESNREDCFRINAEAIGHLASACSRSGCRLIHISTDYVFNGKSDVPYKETDKTDPVNFYGTTKENGEQMAFEKAPDSIVIRTSWVYSRYGKNFVKTMLHLMDTRKEINVVKDQTGSPTYAGDLAEAILKIVANGARHPGIYHYSNKGQISWYEFALAIREIAGKQCNIHPIPSSAYPTPAQRPHYSLLDTGKIESTYHIKIPDWHSSLEKCMKTLV